MRRWLRKGLGAGVLLATGALAERVLAAQWGGGVQPDRVLEPTPADDVDFDAAPAIVRFVNLFLRPQEAAALPFRVDFPYGDPEALDAARAKAGDRDTPLATAVAYLDTDKFEEQLIPDLAWMSALFSFISRSPTYADALITRGGQPGGRWERLRTDISLPKYGRRKASQMFRTPDDLRAFFNTGWALRDADDFETSVIPTSIEWHNFARQGRGQTRWLSTPMPRPSSGAGMGVRCPLRRPGGPHAPTRPRARRARPPGGLCTLPGIQPAADTNSGTAAADDRNDLVLEFGRLARTLRPKAIMMENVPAPVCRAFTPNAPRGGRDRVSHASVAEGRFRST